MGAHVIPCVLGRSGRSARKREGDGATPIGEFPLRQLIYRADKMRRPTTTLPSRAIQPCDGWCDAAHDRNYNRAVRHPYSASAEILWRDDALYDVIVVLGYNDLPRCRGKGSAIFMHIARSPMTPTEGCIAMTRPDLMRFLSLMKPQTRICISGR